MKAMLAKLVGLMLVIFAAGFLAVVAGVVLTLSMDWVTDAQIRDIKAILRGETLPPEEAVESVAKDLEAPRERETLEAVVKAREAQEERLKTLELEVERKKAELQTARQDAQKMVSELDAKLKKLSEEREQFQTEKQAYQDSLTSDGLKKLKEVLEALEAVDAAQMLYDYDIITTVKLLGAMKKDIRAEILSETYKLDKQQKLTDGDCRATRIMKMLGDPKSVASTETVPKQKSVQ